MTLDELLYGTVWDLNCCEGWSGESALSLLHLAGRRENRKPAILFQHWWCHPLLHLNYTHTGSCRAQVMSSEAYAERSYLTGAQMLIWFYFEILFTSCEGRPYLVIRVIVMVRRKRPVRRQENLHFLHLRESSPFSSSTVLKRKNETFDI